MEVTAAQQALNRATTGQRRHENKVLKLAMEKIIERVSEDDVLENQCMIETEVASRDPLRKTG